MTSLPAGFDPMLSLSSDRPNKRSKRTDNGGESKQQFVIHDPDSFPRDITK